MDVEIKYDDRELQRALNRLIKAGGDLTPAMREIAGHLADSVADSFDRERAPDGAPWKPLKEKTKRERRRQGYGDGPILECSGDLCPADDDPDAEGAVKRPLVGSQACERCSATSSTSSSSCCACSEYSPSRSRS